MHCCGVHVLHDTCLALTLLWSVLATSYWGRVQLSIVLKLFFRKLVGATSDGYSESSLSDAAKALYFDLAILKSYVVIDCQLSISDTPGINHQPIKQPPLAEKELNDIVSECDDSSTTITSPK